jgi:hypothetical protein
LDRPQAALEAMAIVNSLEQPNLQLPKAEHGKDCDSGENQDYVHVITSRWLTMR